MPTSEVARSSRVRVRPSFAWQVNIDQTGVNIGNLLAHLDSILPWHLNSIYHRSVWKGVVATLSNQPIPWQSLSEDALRGVIEEFVTREGTEYGEQDVALEAKCRQVHIQLERGEAFITYDEEVQTCSITQVV